MDVKHPTNPEEEDQMLIESLIQILTIAMHKVLRRIKTRKDA